MRVATVAWMGLAAGLAAACGSVANPGADAPPGGGDGPAPVDAHVGPDAPCVDTRIFTGGTDPAAQGWTVELSGFAMVTAPDPNTTQLETQSGGITGGAYLVLEKPGAVTPGQAFTIEVEMMVVQVDPHQQFNGAAVIAGSYSAYPGTTVERRQLVYVDGPTIGWTDDSQSAIANSLDNLFHTYRLAVDAGGNAEVSRDGVVLLTRSGFTTNGTIAIGDLTNQIFIESMLRIRSVTKLCP